MITEYGPASGTRLTRADTGKASAVGAQWRALRLTSSCARLCIDTQQVMAMRILGMGGAWRLASDERDLMVREKVPAFTEAILSAAFLSLSGASPDRVMEAYVQPISDAARRNRTRLASKGPRPIGMFGQTSFRQN
ncbi:MAG: hypothetical protein AAGA05_07515 [Pseudomonadota bacterium]